MLVELSLLFYNIWYEILSGQLATESHNWWIENTLEGTEKRGISNASSGLGDSDNEGGNYDDEEQCKTLGGVPRKINERQPKTKITLYIQQDQKLLSYK